MTNKLKIFVTIVLVAIICVFIGGQTYAEEKEIVIFTDTSVKDDSVKLDTSVFEDFLETDKQVKEKLFAPKSKVTEAVSLSTEAVDNKSIGTVKGPYYLTSVDSAEDILRNEDYVEAVVWYHPVDTEEIKITVRSNTDKLKYITYETEIPYAVLDDIVSILRDNPKSTNNLATAEVKRDYVFPSAESARYLIINEAKYGLKMVIWHGIPDTQVISIAIKKEDGITESFTTGVPRADWDRIEEILLQLDLDNK